MDGNLILLALNLITAIILILIIYLLMATIKEIVGSRQKTLPQVSKAGLKKQELQILYYLAPQGVMTLY